MPKTPDRPTEKSARAAQRSANDNCSDLVVSYSWDAGVLLCGETRRHKEAIKAARLGLQRFRYSRALPDDCAWYIPSSRGKHFTEEQIRKLAVQLAAAGVPGVAVRYSAEREGRSFADREAERAGRAETRAERTEARATKRKQTAAQLFAESRKATEGIPFGQPVLVGHHSEGKHRRAVERGQKKGFAGLEADRAAVSTERKAKSIRRGIEQRTDLGVTRRRIDRLETELRKVRRNLHGHPGGGSTHRQSPATGDYRERLLRMEADLVEQLDHWRALVQEAEGGGEKRWSAADFKTGDFSKTQFGWAVVRRANPKTLTVDHIAHELRPLNPTKVTYDRITDRREGPPVPVFPKAEPNRGGPSAEPPKPKPLAAPAVTKASGPSTRPKAAPPKADVRAAAATPAKPSPEGTKARAPAASTKAATPVANAPAARAARKKAPASRPAKAPKAAKKPARKQPIAELPPLAKYDSYHFGTEADEAGSVRHDDNGFTAITGAQSTTLKTQAGAERWLKKRLRPADWDRVRTYRIRAHRFGPVHPIAEGDPMLAKAERFVARLNDLPGNDPYRFTARKRRKYIAIDRGIPSASTASGVYLVDGDGEVYAIKAYGVPGRRVMHIDEALQRGWDIRHGIPTWKATGKHSQSRAKPTPTSPEPSTRHTVPEALEVALSLHHPDDHRELASLTETLLWRPTAGRYEKKNGGTP